MLLPVVITPVIYHGYDRFRKPRLIMISRGLPFSQVNAPDDLCFTYLRSLTFPLHSSIEQPPAPCGGGRLPQMLDEEPHEDETTPRRAQDDVQADLLRTAKPREDRFESDDGTKPLVARHDLRAWFVLRYVMASRQPVDTTRHPMAATTGQCPSSL